MSYEVRMPDKAENTGLDCAIFATLEEAKMAAQLVRDVFHLTIEECDVVTSNEDATTTFESWSSISW